MRRSLSITLPADILAALDVFADREMRSRSGALAVVLARALRLDDPAPVAVPEPKRAA
jgi:metal-responsive CopG/Arc/MetJ family transcriptional regulator